MKEDELEIDSDHWSQTEEGKKAFLKALNEKFSFTKSGEMIIKHEDSYEPIIICDYYDH